MLFNIHKKILEGLVDFGDVMDVACDDAHWNKQLLSNCQCNSNVWLLIMIIHANACDHKPRPLHHQNQPDLPNFLVYIEKHGEAWVRG